MNVIIKGHPLTFAMEDLRMRADRLLLLGQREDGALLHALLDEYAPGAHAAVADETRDMRKELASAKESAEEADTRADQAEEREEFVQEAAREALEALPKGLAYQYEKAEGHKALAEVAWAVGALSAVLK